MVGSSWIKGREGRDSGGRKGASSPRKVKAGRAVGGSSPASTACPPPGKEPRFAERDIRPSKDVIPDLLRRIDRSAAAVERLDAVYKPVTRALAREAVEGAAESGELFDQADLPD